MPPSLTENPLGLIVLVWSASFTRCNLTRSSENWKHVSLRASTQTHDASKENMQGSGVQWSYTAHSSLHTGCKLDWAAPATPPWCLCVNAVRVPAYGRNAAWSTPEVLCGKMHSAFTDQGATGCYCVMWTNLTERGSMFTQCSAKCSICLKGYCTLIRSSNNVQFWWWWHCSLLCWSSCLRTLLINIVWTGTKLLNNMCSLVCIQMWWRFQRNPSSSVMRTLGGWGLCC